MPLVIAGKLVRREGRSFEPAAVLLERIGEKRRESRRVAGAH